MKWRIALLCSLAVAACASPAPPTAQPEPTRPSQSQPAPPTAQPSPTPGPTATAVERSHFSADDLSFDYPGAWRVIATPAWDLSPIYTWVVVGTGDWESGCVHGEDMVSCSGSKLLVDEGEVAVEVSSQLSGPAVFAFEVPPFEAERLASGLAATIAEAEQATQATIYVPGHRQLDVIARYGPGASHEHEAVADLVRSLRLARVGSPPRTDTWSGQRAGCVETTLRGRLTRGDVSHLVLLDANGSGTFVAWPAGWSASRIGTDRRVELRDASGTVVAREWDEITVGGFGDADEFRACVEAIELLREF